MSFAALAALKDVQAPSSTGLLLLYVLAEYAGPDCTCWPSQTLLAERTQLAVRTVRTTLSALRKAGLIEQKHRHRRDGTRTTDLISLLFCPPEQPADMAACEIASKPRAIRVTAPTNQRQQLPVVQRQKTTGPAAAVAGLTTFEPVTEHITQDAREPRSPAEAESAQGSARGELIAVPDSLRAIAVADPRLGKGWVGSHLDTCLYDPITKTIHPFSGVARGRLSEALGRVIAAEGMRLGELVAERRPAA